MIDVLLMALAIAFFAAADLFVRGCTRILERGSDEHQEDGQ